MLQGSRGHVQHVGGKAGHCCPVWLSLGYGDHIAWLYSAIAEASFTQRWLGVRSISEGQPAAGCPQTPP